MKQTESAGDAMYCYEHIKQLHLEITSACNAACPLCLRNIFGSRANPALPMSELTIDDARKIFPPDFIKQLSSMYMCGNYGDPMVARDTIEVFDYFRVSNPRIKLGIFTNGSGRSPQWWARLARVVDYCRFGIDGLQDTNHLYRQGTSWSKIMESAEAFISAGGRAEWDYIVFRHNEQQVEQARQLSVALGFAAFFVKKTYRFFNLKTGQKRERSPVLNREGRIERFIEGPENPLYQNESLVKLYRLASDRGYESYLNSTWISCKAVRDSKLYVSAEGLAFPCCWTANIYPWYQKPEEVQVSRLVEQLPEGIDSINAKLRPLKEIVDGPLFQQMVPESWGRRSIAKGRLEVCSRVCGDQDLYSAQYSGPSIAGGGLPVGASEKES